ncbi:adenylate cyclase [Pseudomonas sp. PSE14]|uniref:MoaF-related domain-containing protein n=1 Tax=Pseudomonas TaxID=286 RepID=UPI0023D8431A|nr:adenylate cyclase [Pseudomonas sp. PSE14]WEJ69833.1 adenylate cyclase [Pseudomonas sp. PSE14]
MSKPDQTSRPLFAGRGFRVDYDGLSAHNLYSADGNSIRYAIVSGPYAGARGEAACQWQEIGDGVYVISWQEADGATVVHVDDFANGRSQAFFTATDLSFYRMQGPLTEIDPAEYGAQESGK